MCKGADDSHRCTIAFTVTVSGKILPSFVVYQSMKGGRIDRQELPKHPQGNIYTVQRKVWWFDKEVMLQWLDKILRPYAAMAPIGIIPILFLDSFKVHMLGTVADAIHKFGVELKFLQDLPGLSNRPMLVLTSHTKPTTPSSTRSSS